MNKTFSKSYITPQLEVTWPYCVELRHARYYPFYWGRDQFHRGHHLASQKAEWSQHHCTTETISWKNVSTSTVRRRLCEADLYKKQLLRKQNNIKSLQWNETRKDWTIEQCNKVNWTDESKFEIFGDIGGSICGEELMKELQPPVSHQLQSIEEALLWYACLGREDFEIAKSGICINQTSYHSILYHHVISSGTRIVAQGFVLM